LGNNLLGVSNSLVLIEHIIYLKNIFRNICPKAWAGDRLTVNYRAFPGLTSFASKLFYKEDMVIFITSRRR
jgi:hypothetical protein